jgi:phage FluMu protein Com
VVLGQESASTYADYRRHGKINAMSLMKVKCKHCRKRFAGEETKIAATKACPKCKHADDWWYILMRDAPTPALAKDDDPTPLQPLPVTQQGSGNRIVAQQQMGAAQVPPSQLARPSLASSRMLVVLAGVGGVCLIFVVAISAYLIGAASSPDSADEPDANAAPAPSDDGGGSSTVERQPSDAERRFDELRHIAGELAKKSTRFNTQAKRTATVIDRNPTHAELSDEVVVLRREFDAMEALLSHELTTHTYVAKLREYLEFLELAVENFRLSIDFQIKANTGRFTIQEAKALLERADNCRSQVFTCIELSTDSMKEATTALHRLNDELIILEQQIDAERKKGR